MGAIKGLRAVLGVILCLLLGLSLWLTVQRQVLRQEDFTLPGVTLSPVEDDSMAPALGPGDLAVILPRDSYGLGDAVLCADGAIRRAVGTVDGQLIARGDGEGEEAERLLPAGEIRGRVAASLPGAGAVCLFLSQPWGLLAVLAAGVLLLALPTLLGVGREPRERPGQYQGRHARH